MNKAANTYWINNRLAVQQTSARAMNFTSVAATYDFPPQSGPSSRAEVRRRSFTVPSWVFFSMIILATFAICVTVTLRTHAEMRVAKEKFEQITTDVNALRNTNAALKSDVQRLRNDPRAIEAAARTRLNMVRANEIVVPLE